MSHRTSQPPSATAQRSLVAVGSSTLGLVAQVVVLLGTFAMGLGFGGGFWGAAMIQALVCTGLLAWWKPRRYAAVVLAVPLVSAALTFGLYTMATSVTFGCGDRVVAAFEQMPAPGGATFDYFVGGEMQDCMAEIRGTVPGQDVFAHYRKELARHEWRITRSGGGLLRGERDGMSIELYGAEGKVYFILQQ